METANWNAMRALSNLNRERNNDLDGKQVKHA
jgi:hypothetical protein